EAQPGKSFAFSVANNAAATATAGNVNATVTGAPIVGGTKTVGLVGALTLVAGKDNPAPSKETPEVKGLPVLQFVAGIGPESAEAVRITSITVTAAGSSNDANSISEVRLFRDENRNGVADDGVDVRLGLPAKYQADDGTVTFTELSEVIKPGSTTAYLVVYDLSGRGSTGKTVRAVLANNQAASVVGAVSNKSIPVVGTPVFGGEKTISSEGGVTLSAGVSNPGDTNEPLGATNLSMLQLAIKTAPEQAAKLTGIVLRASGTGNDATGISSVRLFADKNNNGLLDLAIDAQIGSSTTFSADDGTVAFTDIDEVIPAGAQINWIVVYNVSETAVAGQRFRVAVATNSAVTAVDPVTNAPLTVSGAPVNGGIKTIATSGSLTIATGFANPGPTNESASASGLSMLQFSLSASTVENVTVTSITLRGSGSGNDESAIAAVKLYRDVNGNGLLETSTDVQLGGISKYSADNGTVSFGGLTEVVPAGARAHYIVTYDLAGTALPGQTFQTSITGGTSVEAAGASSGGAITVGG
ncbi:MAG: hypothetical protein ACK4N5_18010, partial [Myxococcales bacterium]